MPIQLWLGRRAGSAINIPELMGSRTPPELRYSVRLIMPSVAQVLDARRSILEDGQSGGFLGDTVCTFSGLAREILTLSGEEVPGRLTRLQDHELIRQVMAGELERWPGSDADAPGFVEALGRTFRMLRRAGIGPGPLSSARTGLSSESAKRMHRLDRAYEAYVASMGEHHVSDESALIRLAIEAASKDPRLLVGLKHVFLRGFDGFSKAQKDLLRLLDKYCDVTVALDYEEGRPEVYVEAGRTLDFLKALPDTRIRTSASTRSPHNALHHLQEHLFSDGRPRISPDDSVTVLVGGTPEMEIELAAEEIALRARQAGTPYRDFALALPYAGYSKTKLQSVFRRYGIPLADSGRSLAQSELARTVLLCVRLAAEGWDTEIVLAVLRSRHLGCRGENLVSVRSTVGGKKIARRTWLEPWAPDDPTAGERSRVLGPVAAFERAVGTLGAEAHSTALEALVAGFTWLAGEELDRDQAAWSSIRRILTDIVEMERLSERQLEFSEFARLLDSGIRQAVIYSPDRNEGVDVFTAGETRAHTYYAVFILGMLDGLFPRTIREDAFLSFRDRASLNRSLPEPLDLEADLMARQRRMLHSVVCAAREAVFFCHPETDGAGSRTRTSPYMEEVDRLFIAKATRVRRQTGHPTPPVERVASMNSLTEWMASAESDDGAQSLARAVSTVLEDRGVRLPAKCEAEPKPDDAAPEPDKALYTAAELEDYAACPFRWHCIHELGLNNGDDMHIRKYRIVRKTLQCLYPNLFADGTVRQVSFDDAVDAGVRLLRQCVEEECVLDGLPDARRRAEQLSMAQTLKSFLRADLLLIEQSGLAPAHFDMQFGIDDAPGLKLSLSDGTSVELAGRIDRVDKGRNGKAIIVVYTEDEPPSPREIAAGKLLTLPLYWWAVREVFKITPVGAEFRATRRRARSGIYSGPSYAAPTGPAGWSTPYQISESIRIASGFAVEYIEKMRKGETNPTPFGHCTRRCGFRDMCGI